MSDTIRVLIVDDLTETRGNVRKLLQFESDIEVIGEAGNGNEAVEMAQKHLPDIILMDINMPGIDGIGASQKITELVPTVQIIIMSVQSDSDYLRRAMMAGARDFLTKPFGADELTTAIRRVYAKRPAVIAAPAIQQQDVSAVNGAKSVPEGHVLSVFSPKGGSGSTTIAINLAVALVKRNLRVVLVDGSLQFGDVSVMLDLKPSTTIVDIAERSESIDQELINSVVATHKSGLNVLLAPPKPEMADRVTEEHIKKLLETLRQMYDFIILDTSSYLNDIGLALLDGSDQIILVVQQSLPTLKSISRFFDLAEILEYQSEKMWLVVNRASNKQSVSVKDISEILKRPVVGVIPIDSSTANMAADRGVPIVTGQTQKQPVGLALAKLASYIADQVKDSSVDKEQARAVEEKSSSIIGRLFKRA